MSRVGSNLGTMVLQISHCFRPEVSPPIALRHIAAPGREDPQRVVSSTRGGISGRACDARSHPPVPEHSTEVQRCEYGGISEGEVGDSDPPRTSGATPPVHRLPLLGSRVLREHGGSGRADDQSVHPQPRGGAEASGGSGSVGSSDPFIGLRAPSGGLHQTARYAGGS